MIPPGALDVPGDLDHYFRCVPVPEGWAFQVGVVRWPHPHEPMMAWNTVRRWKTQPNAARLDRTRKAVVARGRFFRICSICHELNNGGHMHSKDVCQGCAEREFGVVH